jgi:FtsZ-binding cell division protein ZapB
MHLELNEKALLKGLDSSIKGQVDDIKELNKQLEELQDKKKFLLKSLRSYLEARNNFRKLHPNVRAEDLRLPSEIFIGNNTKIGDAIETILTEYGAMTRKDLLDLLLKSGVHISPKNPRVVLFNALLKDTKKRFAVKDGKVFLNEK